ncbi:YjcZ family sporulation protein [Bacillus carboniphilus]|uniref:YjcZ family sporulation protein n=1 Tax=Bacillus carboniphilus TaxID=86663 RepID=A0ABY9JV99_9BACI|nr:YjcZ family sporulation protein [Bacillus carboniphilus]WLR43317.1 YjcZ family sporulation protein [Bacillus carboniphilus]
MYYNNCCDYAYPAYGSGYCEGSGSGFVLILVLFILLVIISTAFVS